MATHSRDSVGSLLASSYAEHINSAANLILTKGNTLLAEEEINMCMLAHPCAGGDDLCWDATQERKHEEEITGSILRTKQWFVTQPWPRTIFLATLCHTYIDTVQTPKERQQNNTEP